MYLLNLFIVSKLFCFVLVCLNDQQSPKTLQSVINVAI